MVILFKLTNPRFPLIIGHGGIRMTDTRIHLCRHQRGMTPRPPPHGLTPGAATILFTISDPLSCFIDEMLFTANGAMVRILFLVLGQECTTWYRH